MGTGPCVGLARCHPGNCELLDPDDAGSSPRNHHATSTTQDRVMRTTTRPALLLVSAVAVLLLASSCSDESGERTASTSGAPTGASSSTTASEGGTEGEAPCPTAEEAAAVYNPLLPTGARYPGRIIGLGRTDAGSDDDGDERYNAGCQYFLEWLRGTTTDVNAVVNASVTGYATPDLAKAALDRATSSTDLDPVSGLGEEGYANTAQTIARSGTYVVKISHCSCADMPDSTDAMAALAMAVIELLP
jgi:hypothetical protein